MSGRDAFRSAFKIAIFCDHPGHRPREVAVSNFVALPDGGWHEIAASRAPTRGVGAGHHLIGDAPAQAGWANDPDAPVGRLRGRFTLRCRKCDGNGGQGPVNAREVTLFEVLDGWRHAGVLRVPLAVVAATLSSRGAETGPSSEPGQD